MFLYGYYNPDNIFFRDRDDAPLFPSSIRPRLAERFSSSATGTFDHIRDAQTFAGNRLSYFNEIIDSHTWQVVWRLNKSMALA
jgi:hypothetical protein